MRFLDFDNEEENHEDDDYDDEESHLSPRNQKGMKKRGFFEEMWHEITHLEEYMPLAYDYYNNEEEGVTAFRIVNPPNKYVPEYVEYYEDRKRKITKLKTRKHNTRQLR